MLNRIRLRKVFKEALLQLGQPTELEVNISFVNINEIQEINLQERNIDKPTDVLSFPSIDIVSGDTIDVCKYKSDINFETGNLMLGDIVICKSVAKEHAKEYGHTIKRELCFLALHGLLHLLGYDHIEKSDEEKMFKVQNDVLNKLNIVR